MKIILGNQYPEALQFHSKDEFRFFFESNQSLPKVHLESELVPDYWHCIMWRDSLSLEKAFMISFESEEPLENTSLLIWDSHDRFALNTGAEISLISRDLKIICRIPLVSPLMGLSLMKNEFLIIIEEAIFRVIDRNGDMVQYHEFDLIRGFQLGDSGITIKAEGGTYDIRL